MIPSRLSPVSLMAPIFALLFSLGPISASAKKDQTPESEPSLEIIESPISSDSYRDRDGEREIDTVVVHFASAIYWFNPGFQKLVTEEGKARAKELELTPDNLAEHKYDWQLVKAIFDSYNVSSHYMIDREGTIVRLVDDHDIAWHAGGSTMPTDGRKGVNDFSLGIELLASHPDDDPTVKTKKQAYTEAQYEALEKLMVHLCDRHGIEAVVGHDEIAPGRKKDPGPLFDWERVRREDYTPKPCSIKDRENDDAKDDDNSASAQ